MAFPLFVLGAICHFTLLSQAVCVEEFIVWSNENVIEKARQIEFHKGTNGIIFRNWIIACNPVDAIQKISRFVAENTNHLHKEISNKNRHRNSNNEGRIENDD